VSWGAAFVNLKDIGDTTSAASLRFSPAYYITPAVVFQSHRNKCFWHRWPHRPAALRWEACSNITFSQALNIDRAA
jgi:hypothetical protein